MGTTGRSVGALVLWLTGACDGGGAPGPISPQPISPQPTTTPTATLTTPTATPPVAGDPYSPPAPSWPGAVEAPPNGTPTPTSSIAEALGGVPPAIAGIYALSLSPDRVELTVDPQPRATRRARDIGGGFDVKDSARGGKILTLFGGPFRDGAWVRASFLQQVGAEAQRAELRRAGYDLEQTRDLLVVRGERDAESTVFAFSADPGKPGLVGICSQVTIVDFDRPSAPVAVRKPVIYAYPERTTRVRVDVDIDGEFVAVYPAMRGGGWTVTAEPSGELVDEATGRHHRYLFWDGLSAAFADIDPARAHLVARGEAAGFLERACERFAFTAHECGDFVTYWLPALSVHPYNVVEFVDEAAYARVARMTIAPRPDTLVRAFMLFRGSDAPVAVGAPPLPQRVRRGFTVIEWGGAELGRAGRVELR